MPDRAWRAIGGSTPPTTPIGLRAQRSPMDDLTAHAALGLSLRIGESMLALGASAADVTATVLRVADAYGLTSCQVDVTFTSLVVSYDRENAVPLTAMRTVRPRGMDYTACRGSRTWPVRSARVASTSRRHTAGWTGWCRHLPRIAAPSTRWAGLAWRGLWDSSWAVDGWWPSSRR